jgi:hypothetical protein
LVVRGRKWREAREDCIMRSFITCTLQEILIGSKRMRWASHIARIRAMRNTYRILAVQHEGKRPRGRPRRRWEDNVRMNLMEIGWEGAGWIHLAQVRDQWRTLLNTVINLRVP